MPSASRGVLTGILALGSTFALASAAALAQMAMPGAGRSLGGYGASTISLYYGSASGGYIPYNGSAGGFVPYSGGSGGGLGVQTIPRRISSTPIGGAMMAETPIGGASLASGSARSGMGMGSTIGFRGLVPFGYEAGAGMSRMSSTRQGGMRRAITGPGFGSPFRVPPGLTGGSAMSMP